MSRASCEIWSAEIQWPASGGHHDLNEAERWAAVGDIDSSPEAKPTASYSKRAALLAKLRNDRAWAVANGDADIVPPSEAATGSAKAFINSLPDGCLKIRLGISSSGEINFFAGSNDRLLQILIDEDGGLSYYGQLPEGELSADSIAVADFPHMRLFKFV